MVKTPEELVQELYGNSSTSTSMYYQQYGVTNPISALTTGLTGPIGTAGPSGITGTVSTPGFTWLGPGASPSTGPITYLTGNGNTFTYQPMPEYDGPFSYNKLTLNTLMNLAKAGQLTDEDIKVMLDIIAIHKENKEVDIDISI